VWSWDCATGTLEHVIETFGGQTCDPHFSKEQASKRWCENRQDMSRIKRTREGQRLTGKAPSKTMGATTEGTKDVDGRDDGGNGRKESQGKTLSLELRLPLSIFPNDRGSLDYTLSLGHIRRPRICMRPSPHDAAPQGPKTKKDGRVPPKRGTKWLRNERRRACDLKRRHQKAQQRR